VSSPSWYQFLTIAGALAIVNNVPIGGTLSLAVQAATGCSRRQRRGVITSTGALAGHLAQRERHGRRRGRKRQHDRHQAGTRKPTSVTVCAGVAA